MAETLKNYKQYHWSDQQGKNVQQNPIKTTKYLTTTAVSGINMSSNVCR